MRLCFFLARPVYIHVCAGGARGECILLRVEGRGGRYISKEIWCVWCIFTCTRADLSPFTDVM